MKKRRQFLSILFSLILVLSLAMAGMAFAAEITVPPEGDRDLAGTYTSEIAEEPSVEVPTEATEETPLPSQESETTLPAETTAEPATTNLFEPTTEELSTEPEKETSAPEETVTEETVTEETESFTKPESESETETGIETETETETESLVPYDLPTTGSLWTEEEYYETSSDVGYDAYENIGVVMNSKPERYGTLYWPLPSTYGVNSITSGYGYRTGTYSGMHAGLDIGAPLGTPIYACADGVVLESYFSDSAGNFTIIQHEGGIYTEYMHQSVRYVQKGDLVKAGQLIGLVGSTGWSTGPHLHIGVVISDTGYSLYNRVDPTPYLTLLNKLDPSVHFLTQQDLTISYTEGKAITDAAAEEPGLILHLDPILSKNKIHKVSYSGFSSRGYITADVGKDAAEKVISLSLPSGYDRYEDTWIKYEGSEYDLLVSLDASYNSTEKNCPMAFKLDSVGFVVNRTVYVKHNLKKKYYKAIKKNPDNYFSVGLHVEIYKHGTDTRIDLPDIYQAIKDMDKAQSFRCLNEPYLSDKLFVRNKKAFDTNRKDNDKLNKVAVSGDLYSEYAINPTSIIDNPGTAVVYRKTEKVATEGLDLVYGFGLGESTGIDFYIPQYTVSFHPSQGGKVSKSEVTTRSGSRVDYIIHPKAKKGYQFVTWVTDQDVMFADTKLKAGDAITMAQIKEIVITNDMSFTAKFKKIKTNKKSSKTTEMTETEIAQTK